MKTYAASAGPRPSHSPPVTNATSQSPVQASPNLPIQNRFSLLNGDGNTTSQMPDNSSLDDSQVSRPSITSFRSPPRQTGKTGPHKRHHGSADSIEMAGVRPHKMTVGQSNRGSPRVRVSSLPRNVSVSSSHQSPSPPTAVDDLVMPSTSASQDLPLVDNDMPNSLAHQMSQESVISAGPPCVSDNPAPSLRPVSGTQHTVRRSDDPDRSNPSSKPEASRPSPSSSHGPNSSTVGSSALGKPQRVLKVSSQIGKRKALSGAPSKSLN